MEMLSEYEGIPIPEGFSIYIVKEKDSKYYNRLFTFDERGNHSLVEPHELLEKIRKIQKIKKEIGSGKIEKKPIKAEEKFEEFLKQELNMTLPEFDKEMEEEKRWIKQAFKNWMEEQGSL